MKEITGDKGDDEIEKRDGIREEGNKVKRDEVHTHTHTHPKVRGDENRTICTRRYLNNQH